jgi:hypothetical protein
VREWLQRVASSTLSDIRPHKGAWLPRTDDGGYLGFWRCIRVASQHRQAGFATLGHLPSSLAVRLDQAEGLQPLDQVRLVFDVDGAVGAGAALMICLRVDLQGLHLLEKGALALGEVRPGPWGDTVAYIEQAREP